MLPHCNEHDSVETLCCTTCSVLCCKYCIHELHNGHGRVTVEGYNKNKYDEHINKEMQSLILSKTRFEHLQEVARNENNTNTEKDTEILKTLSLRKNILIAKCVDIICDIEKKLREDYMKSKNSYLNALLKKLEVHIENCNRLLDLKEKYNSSNFMEKYYTSNRLVADISEFNRSLNNRHETLEWNGNIHQYESGEDNLLSHSLYESFGIELSLPAFNNNNIQQIRGNFTYKPSHSFPKALENDVDICSFIQRKLEGDLSKSKSLGKNFVIRHLIFTVFHLIFTVFLFNIYSKLQVSSGV